ncbi:response regulator [Sulfurimonas sp. SAG-AH-194-I05]|nr:response regulator [Sulfurimonas sp. SAG-AH-194-I05]
MKKMSDAYTKSTYDHSYESTNSLEVSIESALLHVPTDLMFISNFYALKKFLIWHSMGESKKATQWKGVFTNALVDFLDTKKSYYQARVIDINGDEIINVQYNKSLDSTRVIRESELQNKKGRDYLEKTKTLQSGAFYLSDINLNIEHGAIEKPYIPVIRYATPIFGSDGKAIAVFVINVYATSILQMIEMQERKNEENAVKYYLIDKDGNYFYHKNKDKRWNAQLKNGYNFNEEHLDINTYFKGKKHGSFEEDNKIYSFHELQPLESNEETYWYLVSSVDANIALEKLSEVKMIFLLIILFVILFSYIVIRTFVLRFTGPLSIVTEQLIALSKGEIQKEEIRYKSNDEVGKIIKATQRVVGAIEKTIKHADLVSSGDLSNTVDLLGENDALGLAINEMTIRLKEIEYLAQSLSVGNYDIQVVAKNSNDKLGLALIDMVRYLESVTQVAEMISKGELNVTYQKRDAKDRLGIAMLKMMSYLKAILNQANAISKEDFSQSLRIASHDDQLGIAMTSMTDILSYNAQKNKEELYFSEGIGEFSDTLTGMDSTQELSQVAITMASRYVDASSGVLYIYDDEYKNLRMIASFALNEVADTKTVFKLGEGVVGQVGADKKHMLIKEIQDSSHSIQSATTFAQAKELIVFPLLHEGILYGVAEMTSFTHFTKIHQDYLLKAAGIFAVALHSTIQNVQIKALLEKSQSAFEELQMQSEELQETNVQMEEQQQQLTIQSVELTQQNENLEKAKLEIDQRAEDLEKASKYKSEFLANMSHELRTPLNSIILLSKLLSKNPGANLSSKDIEKTKVINNAGNDLLMLINDILDLTKIESGNMELDISDVYSGDLVEEMKGLFGAIAEDKGIHFSIEDSFNNHFSSDKTKLAQILKNLLSNAIKFTSDGTVEMYIREENDTLIIDVKDTGIGIPQDKIQTIFEAFKQVDGSISRDFGGTGLGLSISKTITDLLLGDISVSSILGEGSTFTLILPLNEDAVIEKTISIPIKNEIVEVQTQIPQVIEIETMLHEEKHDASFENEFKGKNILIVDDDSRNIFTLISAFENTGAEVYTAFNGKEAIELLEDEADSMHIILMDIMMPVMDGLESIKRIKENKRFSHIPIITITAKNSEKDKQICLDSGASDYLAKPVAFNALFSIIKAWIK